MFGVLPVAAPEDATAGILSHRNDEIGAPQQRQQALPGSGVDKAEVAELEVVGSYERQRCQVDDDEIRMLREA